MGHEMDDIRSLNDESTNMERKLEVSPYSNQRKMT